MRGTFKTSFLKAVGKRRLPIHKLSSWVQFANRCATQGGNVGTSQYADRYGMYERILSHPRLLLDNSPVSYLEFGVYKGDSIRWWSENLKHPQSTFVGFDTFTGLPEAWNTNAGVGHFSVNGQVPQIADSRIRYEVGLFQKTLPPFLKTFQRSQRVMLHMDADLYSSTIFALLHCGPLLEAGDLILFDEFACPAHEFRAFSDFHGVFNFPYTVLDRTAWFNQVCIELGMHSTS